MRSGRGASGVAGGGTTSINSGWHRDFRMAIKAAMVRNTRQGRRKKRTMALCLFFGAPGRRAKGGGRLTFATTLTSGRDPSTRLQVKVGEPAWGVERRETHKFSTFIRNSRRAMHVTTRVKRTKSRYGYISSLITLQEPAREKSPLSEDRKGHFL